MTNIKNTDTIVVQITRAIKRGLLVFYKGFVILYYENKLTGLWPLDKRYYQQRINELNQEIENYGK